MRSPRGDDPDEIPKKRIATRVAAAGLFLVVMLNLYGARRAVAVAALAVILVTFRLASLWGGAGDTKPTFRQSLLATVMLGCMFLALALWLG